MADPFRRGWILARDQRTVYHHIGLPVGRRNVFRSPALQGARQQEGHHRVELGGLLRRIPILSASGLQFLRHSMAFLGIKDGRPCPLLARRITSKKSGGSNNQMNLHRLQDRQGKYLDCRKSRRCPAKAEIPACFPRQE